MVVQHYVDYRNKARYDGFVLLSVSATKRHGVIFCRTKYVRERRLHPRKLHPLIAKPTELYSVAHPESTPGIMCRP